VERAIRTVKDKATVLAGADNSTITADYIMAAAREINNTPSTTNHVAPAVLFLGRRTDPPTLQAAAYEDPIFMSEADREAHIAAAIPLLRARAADIDAHGTSYLVQKARQIQERNMGIFKTKHKRPGKLHKVDDRVLIRRPKGAIPDRSQPPKTWPPRFVAKVDDQGHVFLYKQDSWDIDPRPYKHEQLAAYRGKYRDTRPSRPVSGQPVPQ
jgi:hypothetical protein